MKAFWILVILLLIIPVATAEGDIFGDIGNIGKEVPGKGDGYYYVGPCDSGKFKACGQTLWSLGGTGAVELCGNCHPCGGYADGVCPEDFYSSVDEIRGSCSACPDPDCTAFIEGYVMDMDEIGFYSNAIISAEYSASLNLVGGSSKIIQIGRSDNKGYYFNDTLITGRNVRLKATYYHEATDTTYISTNQPVIDIVRGEDYYVNFTMDISTCEDDCTRQNSNKCDKTCIEEEGCDFPENAKYSEEETAAKAHDKEKTIEEVTLETWEDETTIYTDYFTACEGEIQTREEPKVGAGINLEEVNNDIDNLVTRIHRVWYQGRILEMVIMYWDDKEI